MLQRVDDGPGFEFRFSFRHGGAEVVTQRCGCVRPIFPVTVTPGAYTSGSPVVHAFGTAPTGNSFGTDNDKRPIEESVPRK